MASPDKSWSEQPDADLDFQQVRLYRLGTPPAQDKCDGRAGAVKWVVTRFLKYFLLMSKHLQSPLP